MASSIQIYQSFRDYANAGVIDLTSTNIYLALVLSSYTLDLTQTIWSQVSGNEVLAGSGYTTGGNNLTSSNVGYTGATANWTAANVTWTTLTKTFRYGVLYLLGTVKTIVNPLIAVILFNTAPADIVVSGVDFTVIWNAAGIFSWS